MIGPENENGVVYWENAWDDGEAGYIAAYEELMAALRPVDALTHQRLESTCKQCTYLRLRHEDDVPDYSPEYLYPFHFFQTDSKELLERYLAHSHWQYRQGIVYENVAFVCQTDRQDDWKTFNLCGDRWLEGESVFCREEIRDGRFTLLLQEVEEQAQRRQRKAQQQDRDR